MFNIRATSLGSFISCPLKFHLDKNKVWKESNALDIGKIVHLSRQSPLLALDFLDRLAQKGNLDARELVDTKKMIEVMANINKEIPDNFEIAFEVDLQHKFTLNGWQIECLFTGHPDEIRINKETKKIEKIFDTKTSGVVSAWKEGKMLDYAKQHIYYPYLLSKCSNIWETVEFTYRVAPKKFFSADEIFNLTMKINVAEAIKETEDHIKKYLNYELNGEYNHNENVQCYWCDHKKDCPKNSLLSNF